MMNDNTVMKRLPISVTAHSGILSKKPQSSIADTISLGSVILSKLPMPDAFMMVLTIPCTISKSAIISSSPYVTTPFAIANLMKSFRACSGFFTSAKLPQVFTTPTTKKKNQQCQSYRHKCSVYVRDHFPYRASFEILRRLRQQLPHLRKLIVPCA